MSSSDTKLRQEMRRVDSREAQMAERQTSCLRTLIITTTTPTPPRWLYPEFYSAVRTSRAPLNPLRVHERTNTTCLIKNLSIIWNLTGAGSKFPTVLQVCLLPNLWITTLNYFYYSDEVILFLLINLQIVWFIKGQNFSNKFSFLEPDKDIDFTITEDEEKQKLFIFQ